MTGSPKGKKAVFGVFDAQSTLEEAVSQLKATGFRQSDISIVMPGADGEPMVTHEMSNKAPEGAATGATTGFALGGVLGWLVGAGSLAIPGIGPLVAAGPILAAIAGAGVGSALGGISGALIGYGIPEYVAKKYVEHIQKGGYLLTVHVDDENWQMKAKGIFAAANAHDISVVGEEHSKSA